MANIKSAKKRARQSEKRRTHNRYYRTTARTHIKNACHLIDEGNFEAAESVIQQAVKVLDKAAQKGLIAKNNAARRKSRLMLRYNKAKAAAAN